MSYQVQDREVLKGDKVIDNGSDHTDAVRAAQARNDRSTQVAIKAEDHERLFGDKSKKSKKKEE